MEQLIAGAKFPAKCVKNEIHNLLTTLRLSRSRAAHGAPLHGDILRSLQQLFEELTYIHELHEFDTVAYLGPFLEVIQSDATDGQITAAALGSIDKFVSFGLISPESPRCSEAINTLALGVLNCRFISSGVANDEVVLLKMVGVLINCLRCPAGEYLSDPCVWHMVRKCFLISRQSHSSHLLRSSAEETLKQMVLTIFGTHKTRAHRVRVTSSSPPPLPGLVATNGAAPAGLADAVPAAPAGDSAAGGAVFSASDGAALVEGPAGGAVRAAAGGGRPAPQVHRPYGFRAMHFVLRFLSFLLAYGRGPSGRAGGNTAGGAGAGAGAGAEGGRSRSVRPRKPRSRSPSCDRLSSSPRNRSALRERSPADGEDSSSSDLGLNDASASDLRENVLTDTHCLGLSLLNVALESGGDEIARSDELICVIQDDICKSLLQNSRTDSLSVLSLTLRAIFNLFLHFKRHLKVQLEIFFTSVHLKIAGFDAASYEQREIALESLLEFCREPELMLELYENYDCDVRCTNLFETLVRFLVTNSCPLDGASQGFSALHRLALSGLCSILHAMALRCEGHRHFRGEKVEAHRTGETSASMLQGAAPAATDLQSKKEQKRRLTLAARTFNSEPSKSMAALQNLGFVSNPPTPESMAEFLRHTPGLDLRVVGEYIAKRGDFNAQVRKAYLELFPFTGLGLVDALRMLLSSFRLPGEAQLIERLMECFAEAYFTSQPPIPVGAAFSGADGGGGSAAEASKPQDPLKTVRWIPRERQTEDGMDGAGSTMGGGGGPEEAAGEAPQRVKMGSSDTVFVLAFSIIMLNTDLHSVKVMKKMTDAEFIRNNRGIDSGKDLPAFFLRDIYEAIRDDEIRLHGDAPVEGGQVETVVDDFYWEGILRRSESIDEFSTTERLLSETPPGATEREMLKVILDCSPVPLLSQCYESVSDIAVTLQSMTGVSDLARLGSYFEQVDTVNSLVRVMCQSFTKASSFGCLTPRAQVALRGVSGCISQHMLSFREAEWRDILSLFVQLWALDLLPRHLTELDDFASAEGRPLETSCALQAPFPAPGQSTVAQAVPQLHGSARTSAPEPVVGSAAGAGGPPRRQDTADGFLESLARWFEDEIRDDEELSGGEPRPPTPSGGAGSETLGSVLAMGPRKLKGPGSAGGTDEGEEDLPMLSADVALVHQRVVQYVVRSGFSELFTPTGLSRLPTEAWQALARAVAETACPPRWADALPATRPSAVEAGAAPEAVGGAAGAEAGGPGSPRAASQSGDSPMAMWHKVADPLFALELLTNMACMPQGAGQSAMQIWPLVSSQFERLLRHLAGGGSGGVIGEPQFVERLVVNTLRLCIRLMGESQLTAQLLELTRLLSRLPPELFSAHSERIACGLLVLVKEPSFPYVAGLPLVFILLKRISEFPGGTGACSAGIECLNHWLGDDKALAQLTELEQFPELLATLQAFASQNSTPAAAVALEHLSTLVPQLARGARSVGQVGGHWQSLWVPTLHSLADIAKKGSQRSSAQAFVYLQRLLLERGTEMSLPWEQVPFNVWKECLEQIMMPLLQAPVGGDATNQIVDPDGARQAGAAQLVCRVVLTHMPDWLRVSPDDFAAVFLRLLDVLVREASADGAAREQLVESLKNLLLVTSADPAVAQLVAPQPLQQAGMAQSGGAVPTGTLLECAWAVVSPAFPELRGEIALILDPFAADVAAHPAEQAAAPDNSAQVAPAAAAA